MASILAETLAKEQAKPENLAEAIQELFEPLGGIDLPEVPVSLQKI